MILKDGPKYVKSYCLCGESLSEESCFTSKLCDECRENLRSDMHYDQQDEIGKALVLLIIYGILLGVVIGIVITVFAIWLIL